MTDDQVMKYVVKEHERGTSNAQIVTKLMQQGVDISQIRRVRNKYERQMKQGGIAGASEEIAGKDATRLRTNNGKGEKITIMSTKGRKLQQLSHKGKRG